MPVSLLTCTWLASDLVIEPGPVEVIAGSGSRDIRSSATFTVTGQARAISGGGRAFLSTTIVGPR